MDPLRMAAFFEQLFGFHVPGPVLVVLVVLGVVLLIGATIREIVQLMQWYRSVQAGYLAKAVLASPVVQTAFSFKFLLWLGAAVWVVLMALAVWRIGDDMNRYVLPRRLTDAQKNQIAAALTKFKPHDVEFNTALSDSEADYYRSDIQQAIEKGGWPVIELHHSPNPPNGLSLSWSQPPEAPKTPADLARERIRPSEPRPIETLSRVLQEAGVQLDAIAQEGTTSPSIKVTITVGPRRRDRFAVQPQQPFLAPPSILGISQGQN